MKKIIGIVMSGFLLAAMIATPEPVFATDGPTAVISAGNGVTFAVQKDGSLWGYGNPKAGLGIDSADTIQTPVKIMDQVKSAVTNDGTSFAIKKDDTLWAWGDNAGKFGNGASDDSITPVKVMDDVKLAAVEKEYTLVIKTDGSLWGTGQVPGKLPGLAGTTVYEFQPIMEGETFKFISVCGYYAMAVKENGELWAWGDNAYGALGTGNADEEVPMPVKVMDQVAFVSANSFNSMIVREDGALYMAGIGYNGQFYNGAEVVKKINGDGIVRSPLKIMDSVLYASNNGNRWLVVKRDNTLWGWGADSQFGLFGSNQSMLPSKLMDKVSYISGGSRHLAVLRTDQTLWTGGQNATGGIAGHEAAYKSYPLQQDLKNIMDAPAAWALQEVNEAIAKGLVPSEMQSDYSKPITRKEFSKLVVTMIEKKSGKTIDQFIADKGLSMPEQTPFTDVDDHYVNSAYSLAIVNGIGHGLFDPDKTINRQEAAKMLTATATALGYKTDASMPHFTDEASIDEWAKPYIGYMNEIGVMKGSSGKFDPKGTYVRQMAFITMNRIFEKL